MSQKGSSSTSPQKGPKPTKGSTPKSQPKRGANTATSKPTASSSAPRPAGGQSTQRARDRREERERERRRQQRLTYGIAAVAVVVVVFVLVLLSSVPAEAPIPADITTRYSDIIQSTDDNGFPVLGNPDAPVKVVEYSSFSCPACATFHDTVFPSLIERIERGEISFTFVPLQTGSIPNPEGAARSALCASEQGRFWELHDVLFDWHTRFGNNAFTHNRLTAGVSALELDSGAYNACFNSSRTSDILLVAQQQGVSATPTIRINGTTVGTSLSEIETAISQFGPFTNLESGLRSDSAPATEEPTAESTSEAASDSAATEAPAVEATTEATAEAETTPEATAEGTSD